MARPRWTPSRVRSRATRRPQGLRGLPRYGRPCARPAPARCPARSPRRDRRAPAGPRVGGQLTEQLVLGATADHVHDAHLVARELAACSTACREPVGQAGHDDAHRATRPSGAGTVVLAAPVLRCDSRGMSPGGRKRGSWMSIDRHAGRRTPRPRRAASPGQLGAPRAQRLREQPDAHHVAQEPDPAVDAALVGEVGRRAASVRTGCSSSTPTSAPGAAGDVRRRSSLAHRHADHGGRGVVRADATTTRRRQPVASATSQRADDVPGSTQRRQHAPARARPASSSSVVPLAGAHVEQPGGRGVRALADRLPGQPVGQQVGDQQQPAAASGSRSSAASW